MFDEHDGNRLCPYPALLDDTMATYSLACSIVCQDRTALFGFLCGFRYLISSGRRMFKLMSATQMPTHRSIRLRSTGTENLPQQLDIPATQITRAPITRCFASMIEDKLRVWNIVSAHQGRASQMFNCLGCALLASFKISMIRRLDGCPSV